MTRSRKIRRQLRRAFDTEDVGLLKRLGSNHAADVLLTGFDHFLDQVEASYAQSDEKLKLAARNLQISSDELTEANRELEALNAAMRSMLGGLGQALMLFGRDGLCGDTYSSACLDLFGRSPAGRPIFDVLGLREDARLLFRAAVDLAFGDGDGGTATFEGHGDRSPLGGAAGRAGRRSILSPDPRPCRPADFHPDDCDRPAIAASAGAPSAVSDAIARVHRRQRDAGPDPFQHEVARHLKDIGPPVELVQVVDQEVGLQVGVAVGLDPMLIGFARGRRVAPADHPSRMLRARGPALEMRSYRARSDRQRHRHRIDHDEAADVQLHRHQQVLAEGADQICGVGRAGDVPDIDPAAGNMGQRLAIGLLAEARHVVFHRRQCRGHLDRQELFGFPLGGVEEMSGVSKVWLKRLAPDRGLRE